MTHPTAPVSRDAALPLTTHEQIGFELGWDYAHHGVLPPAPYAQEASALRSGLVAGQAAFGGRTLAATGPVRQWLQLRLHAWLRGIGVERVQITPHYLQQLAVSHCPVTRAALDPTVPEGVEGVVARVRNDAAYAAGNLAVMSPKAAHAKAAYGFHDALRFAQQIDAASLVGIAGLTAIQWRRVATLCSFVESLPHEEAAAIPLRVLPPNRLRLFNPVQALQAFVSRQLLVPGWAHRMSRFEELLPGAPVRRAFQGFFHALLPRVLDGTRAHPEHAAWAVEDAWDHPLVLKRWVAWAALLDRAQCEALVARAAARKLAAVRTEQVGDEQATEGWQLDSRGYVPHGIAEAAPRMVQATLL